MKIEYGNVIPGYNCPNCGAPVRTAICEYCGSETGFTEEMSFNEYRTINKKTISLGFFNTIFPLMFAFPFTLMPISFIAMSIEEHESEMVVIPGMILFIIFGIGAFAYFFINVFGYLSLVFYGKKTEGVVYGFTEDDLTINDEEALRVKILTTMDGRKGYMYLPTYDTVKTYRIGDRIPIKYTKKYVMLED